MLCRKQIAEERASLEAAGSRVYVFHMDDAAMPPGGSLMNAELRLPAAAAGEAQGGRIAQEIAAAWG